MLTGDYRRVGVKKSPKMIRLYMKSSYASIQKSTVMTLEGSIFVENNTRATPKHIIILLQIFKLRN